LPKTDEAKCGNFYLRYYLVEASNLLRMHVDEYTAFYYKKYKEINRHQHKRALVLTARKLCQAGLCIAEQRPKIYRPRGMVTNT